ncbi:MAG: hypothetical protein WDW38_006579 [Sanguina aurantia]
MFVQTEWDAASHVLLATRRRRATSEARVWAAQALQIEGSAPTEDFDTDRARFLGRGHTLRHAQAMEHDAKLSRTTGCVLDPVFALRQGVTLAPGASVTLLLWTKLADSREGAMALATSLADSKAAGRVFDGAAQHAQGECQRLAVDAAKTARFATWMSALLVSDAAQRSEPAVLERGHGGPPTLWGAGISGDRPIVLLQMQDDTGLPLLDELFLAQVLWRSQRLAADVVILNAASDSDALLSNYRDKAGGTLDKMMIDYALANSRDVLFKKRHTSAEVVAALYTPAIKFAKDRNTGR